jgi:methionine-rich copper-binding protein CopC
MKSLYNLRLNLLVYLSICFFVLIPISKADYVWNGNLTLSGGELTGSVGSVNITIEELSALEGGKAGADGNITISPITMFQPEDFPSGGDGDLINFGITGVTTFREDHGQSYKLTFSQPVDNPLVAISSLGNPSNINTFTIDSINGGSAATTNILWQQNSSSGFTTSVGSGNTNYNLDASVSAMTNVTFYRAGEGDFVSRVNAENVTSIEFSLASPETYMTIMVGYDEAADATTSTVSASLSSVLANGTSSSTITVQVKDGFGNNFLNGGETVNLSSTLGTLSSVTDNSNGTYTATLTSTTVGTATISATLNSVAVTDTASVSFTNVPPTLSSSSPSDDATGVSSSTNIVLTFSEAVDVETGNITIKKTSDNSTVETINVTSIVKVTGSGTTTITVNPDTTLAVSTEYYVLIDATAFDDVDGGSYAGISSTTALSFTTGADSTPPTMTITAVEGSDGFQSDDATLSLTFTSNEATSNFAVGDITVSNGTLSDFNASSSTVYTATLTPIAAGEVTVDVAAATFTDGNANNNLAATQFNWNYGIDPSAKADVIGTVESMSNSSINFTRTSIRSVRNRLYWLERNGSKNTSNQGIKVSFKNPILNTILNNTKDNSYDIERLVYNVPIKDEYSKVVYNPLSDYLFSELNTKVSSVVKENTNIKIANLNPQGKALINNWSFWSAGQIFVGKVDATSTSSGQNSDGLNLAFGMDRPMKNREGLIGFALNVGQDDTEIGSAGSDTSSDNISLSYYNVVPKDQQFEFETQVGIGYMNVDSLRIDGDQRLKGKRDIWMPFGAVTLRNKSYQFENGTFTPYGRGEVAFIQLDPYAESGGNLALSYNKQTIDRYMLFLGSDINFDKTYKDGKLKPFAAIEYGLDLTSNSEVKMNYVGSSTVYQTELEKLASSNVMMKLGLDYEGKDQTNLAFSYERNEAIGAGHSNSIQIKFSKPLGKVN